VLFMGHSSTTGTVQRRRQRMRESAKNFQSRVAEVAGISALESGTWLALQGACASRIAGPGLCAAGRRADGDAPARPESGGGSAHADARRLDDSPFFQPLGANGRACGTCHLPSDGWSLAPATARRLFDATEGRHVLFRPRDGANAPNLPDGTLAERRAASSLLLTRGLIRVGLPIPPGAEFVLDAVDDPYGFASARELSLYRGRCPPPISPSFSTVMWDGRESRLAGAMASRLAQQADGASAGHAQEAVLGDEQRRAIVAFETGLVTAQSRDAHAGDLEADGARGGPQALADQSFFPGINSRREPGGFDRRVFSLFGAWAEAGSAARRAIARGEKLFNARAFAGGNFTCTTCHNAPNAGSNSMGATFDLGLTAETRRAADVPLYTLRCLRDGAKAAAGRVGTHDGSWRRAGDRALRRYRTLQGSDPARSGRPRAVFPRRLGRHARRGDRFLRQALRDQAHAGRPDRPPRVLASPLTIRDARTRGYTPGGPTSPMIIRELQRLHHAQGFVGRAELSEVAARLGVPLYRVHEVASFYPHFRTSPPPEVVVRVCRDMSCRLRGAGGVLRACEAVAGQQPPGRLTVEGVSCLGRCDRAPALAVEVHRMGSEGETRLYTGYTPAEARALVHGLVGGGAPPSDLDADHDDGRMWEMDVLPRQAGIHGRRTARRAAARARRRGRGCPRARSSSACARPGCSAWAAPADARTRSGTTSLPRRAMKSTSSAAATRASRARSRTGRSSCARRTWCWKACSSPAWWWARARGYVYIRHEYPEQIARMRAAIADAEARRLLSFPIEVFISPGWYICGEQTAMIQVLEDKRAEPRNRPPELQTNGLWDRPTLVNNVETLAWVPSLLLERETANLRLFAVSGDVEAPGVYEVRAGITLGALIARAGGMRGGRDFKAVAPSGASGGFLPRYLDGPSGRLDILEWPLDVQGARDLG
jgi:formate dehydrogenase/bidirectional [NiFe] hydrogenase diaphorase subunit